MVNYLMQNGEPKNIVFIIYPRLEEKVVFRILKIINGV